MALDVALLRSSFTMVSERCPTVIARFYEILFERHPETIRMFPQGPGSLGKQELMLTKALAAVLDHLEDASWLKETLFHMGARHVSYGVRDEMYGWVGECLLASLAEAAAADWSPELASQWTEAYGAIASMMLAGAESVRVVPPAAKEESASV